MDQKVIETRAIALYKSLAAQMDALSVTDQMNLLSAKGDFSRLTPKLQTMFRQAVVAVGALSE